MSCLEAPDSRTRHRIELPRGHDAPGIARQLLDVHFAHRLTDFAYTNARMIVSELVTNAFMHGAGRIHLGLELRDGTLRIEVADEGTGEAPAIRELPDGSAGGWGLRIVETLAVRWGALADTTLVWAEIAAKEA